MLYQVPIKIQLVLVLVGKYNWAFVIFLTNSKIVLFSKNPESKGSGFFVVNIKNNSMLA